MVIKFLFILVLLLPCISANTITLNKSLIDGDILLSKKATFALGFFSPGKSGLKYLGIWYNKLPGQDVVWVANRRNPINGSSGVLSVTADGNLVLFSNRHRKISMWSTNVSIKVKDACVAQLLDSGNLVLVQSETRRVVWQSFDFPSDTMLPGMKLGLDRKTGLNRFLTSWKSVDDPDIGEYSYKLNPAGSPQFFLYKGLEKYWRTIPWPCGRSRYAPDPLYRCNFENKEEEIFFVFFVDDESVIIRTVVDVFGIFHRLTWDNGSRQWKESWSAPNYAYGHCGANSIYSANSGHIFGCSCLPGYEPRSLKEWNSRDGTGGCIRKHRQATSSCRSGEGFVKVEQVKVPDTSVAALMNVSMSSEECQKFCFTNCSCVAFASIDVDRKGMTCMTWYSELIDTIKYDEGPDLYIRVNAIEMAENAAKSSFPKRKSVIIGFSVAFISIISCLIFIYYYLWLRQRKIKGATKNKHMRKRLSTMMENRLPESRQHPDFPYFDPATVLAATNNFSPANKLGQGGFGSVHKGKLMDGREIAVKRLSQSSGQGIEEFENEVMLIARLQHRNLVKLLGCCVQEKMLIYEYLPNISLDTFIFDQERRVLLDWRKRFDIIVGIARGMLYLHQDSRLRIVHRDLKTSNVLLDAEMNPKISDFGVARIINGDLVQDNTKRVVGTYGYMAPEYVVFGKFSTKSDVFSFGVILLEIISGKKNSTYLEESQLNLIGNVWDLWREGRALDVVDSLLRDSCIASEVVRCIHIGLLCVQKDKEDRPTMAAVVLMLNSETSLPFPKEPAFILQRNCNSLNSTSRERACSVNEVTITMIESR